MSDFSDIEKAAFEFLQLYHPEQLIMMRVAYKGKPVSLLCSSDNNTLRPIAFMLTDEMIAGITIEGKPAFEIRSDNIEGQEIPTE